MSNNNYSKIDEKLKKQRQPRIIIGEFVECESCHYWLRILPEDEHGNRKVPVKSKINTDLAPETNDIYMCENCYDRTYNMKFMRYIKIWPKLEAVEPSDLQPNNRTFLLDPNLKLN